MKTTDTGKAGEDWAAKYLADKGFEIIARNWKTRWCEIDIVAKESVKRGWRKHNEIIHFVEVKYRKNPYHGSGLEYITKRKSEQLKFAARWWVSENKWEGDCQIDAVGVDGMSGQIDYVANAIGF